MWTHANTMHTHVDCPQKCGQMQTMNTDTDVPSMGLQKLGSSGAHSAITTDRPIFVPSWGRTLIGSFLYVLAWRRGDARISFADTADICRQEVWTDEDCPQ